jgi:hypothetical protein
MYNFDFRQIMSRRTALACWLASAGAIIVAPCADAQPPAPIAAPPFTANGSALDHSRAVRCLAYAIYYEAGNQSVDGQKAVAQVVLNRVRNPTFPRTVCGVVFQGAHSKGCQFTFACDGSMARAPEVTAWRRAAAVAESALAGGVMAQVGVATYYHADYVSPHWSNLSKTAKVGAHIFYTPPSESAQLAARYAGREPVIDVRTLLAVAAVPAEHEPDLDELLDVEPHTLDEPHAADDTGGRVDLGHGWAPTAAPPKDNALSHILAAQGG